MYQSLTELRTHASKWMSQSLTEMWTEGCERTFRPRQDDQSCRPRTSGSLSRHVAFGFSDGSRRLDAGAKSVPHFFVDRNIDIFCDLQRDGDRIGHGIFDVACIGAAVHSQLQAVPLGDDAGILAVQHLVLDRTTAHGLPPRLASYDPQRGAVRVEPEVGLAASPAPAIYRNSEPP